MKENKKVIKFSVIKHKKIKKRKEWVLGNEIKERKLKFINLMSKYLINAKAEKPIHITHNYKHAIFHSITVPFFKPKQNPTFHHV